MNVRISRQHWDGLLAELEQARRQRHLLTYRALLERLQLPSPAMLTLTAALEHLAGMDAKADQPLRSSLVISQGAGCRVPVFSSVQKNWGVSQAPPMGWRQPRGMLLRSCEYLSSFTNTKKPDVAAV